MTVVSSKSTYETYFTELVTAHVDLTASVVGYDLFLNSKSEWEQGKWYAVIGDYECRIDGHGADNYTGQKPGSITIIRKPGSSPKTEIPILEDEAERLCIDIISRMYRDMRSETRNIVFRQTRISFIDHLMAGGYCGARLEVDFVNNINLKYNDVKWSDSWALLLETIL